MWAGLAEKSLGKAERVRQGWLNGKLILNASCKLQWVVATVGGLSRREKLPVSHESSLKDGARAKQVSSIVPSLTPSPTDSATTQQRGLPHPSKYLRPCPLTA